MVRFITGGRASGKTTRALMELESQGGGVFVTQNSREAMLLVKQHGLEGVTILEIDPNTSIAIDDTERIDIIAVRNGPPIRTV